MSTEALRILMIATEGIEPPRLAADSGFGPFETMPCPGMDAASQRLAILSFDAVVVACRPAEARGLTTWPMLSHAVGESAFVVLTTEVPGADLTVLLVRRGVQDVLPLDADPVDTLPRALRLAIERKTQERLIRKAYATDLMTGLPNQGQLLEHLHQLLALREREPAPMALLALRVDGLAAAETQYGAEAANVLRRKVAVRLRAAVRGSDVVASTGSDTFAVLLPRFQEANDAEHVAAKLSAAIAPSFSVAGRPLSLSVAIGVARHPRDGKDASSLLRRAAGLAAAAQPSPPPATPAAPPAANDDSVI